MIEFVRRFNVHCTDLVRNVVTPFFLQRHVSLSLELRIHLPLPKELAADIYLVLGLGNTS